MATRNRRNTTTTSSDAPALQEFTLGLDFDESWDFEANPVLEGTVKAFDIIEVNRRGGKAPVGCFTVEVDGVTYAVWESKKLEKLFACVEPGWHVRIEYKGKRKLGGGQSMREYSAQVGSDCTPRREIIEARVTQRMRMQQQSSEPEAFDDDIPF